MSVTEQKHKEKESEKEKEKTSENATLLSEAEGTLLSLTLCENDVILIACVLQLLQSRL